MRMLSGLWIDRPRHGKACSRQLKHPKLLQIARKAFRSSRSSVTRKTTKLVQIARKAFRLSRSVSLVHTPAGIHHHQPWGAFCLRRPHQALNKHLFSTNWSFDVQEFPPACSRLRPSRPQLVELVKEIIKFRPMPSTSSDSSLSELDSNLSGLSLVSDSDNEPLRNGHQMHPPPPEETMEAASDATTDSDDKPLINHCQDQPPPPEEIKQAPLVAMTDSDDEPLINRWPVHPPPAKHASEATPADSDDEPLINRWPVHPVHPPPAKSAMEATRADSNNKPLINGHPVAPKHRDSQHHLAVGNIPARRKHIRKNTATMKAYQHRRSQEGRPGRRTKRKQLGINSTLTTNIINGNFCKMTMTPVPCNLFPAITAEYGQMKQDRQISKDLYKRQKGPEPSKKTIYKRKPTVSELDYAYKYVNNPSFKLYDYGHIQAFDGTRNDQLIADIHFTNLVTLSQSRRDGLNFLCLFLHEAKQFVNSVKSPGRSCGGVMWAVGWRKLMVALEMLGIYCNQKAIDKYPEEYAKHINNSKKASQILWSLFHPIANIALQHNQDFLIEHNIPAFFDSAFPGQNQATPESTSSSTPESMSESTSELTPESFFSSNLTFTAKGFYNHPHVDDKEEPLLPFAFLLSLPTCRKTGKLTFKSGYNLNNGPFIFPECKFGIKFQPDVMCQATF
ncbi:hypothetical protein PTTG_25668 [Puccinia triticina 1-1 BBBD Race 1]|uniref:Tet-like 2OG-Fe(II) oxygenase domain-containing protein n=1 Tax=Puccinia triticina (isolate 1-1 / race 1 (BBBD)) TaxID=630390 RepID=A0A180H1I5_PUCT1|nr:hypothetical protein PTTG_25668 [Puccinia triticina 1-1 BBBD Race 1]